MWMQLYNTLDLDYKPQLRARPQELTYATQAIDLLKILLQLVGEHRRDF